MTTPDRAVDRPDLDGRAAAFYGCDVPPLAEGDEIRTPDRPNDRFIVEGFGAGGMMVDVTRLNDHQAFSLPRHYTPMVGDAFFLTAWRAGYERI